MPAASLSSMAQHAAIRNIASITDIADLPYHAVEPILRRIDNPQQLREIEINCPHVADHSKLLWQEFIKRDVSNADQKMLYPKDPRSWHKVYRKMLKQEEAEKAEAEEGLKRAMMGLQEAKGSKETRIVNKVMEHGQKKRTGFFDGVMHTGGTGGGGGSRAPLLWNAKTGRDAFGAMQRATANKASAFKPMTRRAIPDPKSQIKVAPKSMVMEYSNPGNEAVRRAAAEAKKYAEPQSQNARIFTSRSRVGKTEQAFRNEDMKEQLEKERRLRALTNPVAKAAMHPAPASSSAGSGARASTTSSQRSSVSPTKSAPKATSSLAPSNGSVQAKQSVQQKPATAPAPVKRKRPTVDPFLSVKRSRP